MLLNHSGERAIQRRNDRRHDRAVERSRGVADELPREDPVLVCRALSRGGQSPRAGELVTVVDAEDDVGVADVDDEEIGHRR